MKHFQQDILRRHGLASIGAALFSALFIVSALIRQDGHSITPLLTIIGVYWLGQLALLAWVMRGHSRGYQDPGMTPVFMCWAVLFISLALMCCQQYRTIALLGYMTVMPYGVFRLTWRGFLGVSLFTMAAYTSVMLAVLHNQGFTRPAAEEAVLGAAFFASLVAYSFLGREVALLREAYRQKNRELRRAMGRIEELAVTDELTGLYNRRYLLRSLEKSRALANREGLPFVLAFVDLDHFKQINDQHGHRIGDQVLTELAQLLRLSVREVDLAARYGGEEFVLLLSGLTLAAAEHALNRIRSQVLEQRFSEEALPLTVSVGVTQYIPGEEGDELINRADRLLYEAKRCGRNRVVADPEQTITVLATASAGA
ncbi:GGDEF domain-containing protein [Thalassolituus sp. LLYu03]|uniref:GGDEF domain-containing protein n=1 Tax=Thalassolituus sp. LLYu03 TaxID=3421656 RepID=UPI003D2A1241